MRCCNEVVLTAYCPHCGTGVHADNPLAELLVYVGRIHKMSKTVAQRLENKGVRGRKLESARQNVERYARWKTSVEALLRPEETADANLPG